ncbi:hypothetical protein ACHAWO_009502 [Cyclotella atomus]|uniref:Trafficking protein particle complex subunit 12 n=1 Tax=Cyclotella atomus TaxID=382360 RepID=A0ABD3N796_9STRA
MASNNPPHPIQSGTSSKSGLGRSAPIRTVPQMSGGIPPPLAVPQYGLAQTVSTSKPSASRQVEGARSAVSSHGAARSVASSSSDLPSKCTSMQANISSNPTTREHMTSRSTQHNSELQPHVVPLPPPQQTQFHPLGSSQQLQQHSTVTTSQQFQPHSQPSSQNQQLPTPPQINPNSPQQPHPSQMQQQYTPARKATFSTPDEEVDAFLLNSLGSTSNQSPSKSHYKTRPASLPSTDNLLQKSQLLATRRAWGDVIRVTNDALMIKNVEREGVTHADVYSELISTARGDVVVNNLSKEGDKTLDIIRRETCELITLRCIAHLKLRRYVDLGKEISQLGLIPYLPPHPSSISVAAAVPASPGAPSPGGTEVVPLSSVAMNANTGDAVTNHSLSWKEGSIHSSEAQDKLPTWVPYGLRILAAQQLQYVDGSSKAIDVLYDMRDRAVRTRYWSTPGLDVWCSTIDNALVNAFVRKKEWRLALCTLEDMMNGLDAGAEREVEWWCRNSGQSVDQGDRSLMKDLIVTAATVELMSRELLILLQCGALDAARTVQTDLASHVTHIQAVTQSMKKSQLIVRLVNEAAIVRQAPFRLQLNEGLLLFADGNYTDASSHFRDALQCQKEMDKLHLILTNQPLGCPSWKELAAPTLGFDAESSLTVECLNNLSLCLLYSGNMRRAVYELEGLVREDPTMYLTEGMAFNLCTLYELGSDGEECTRRKKLLQRCAKRFYLHDVGVESFRLN